MTSLAPGKEAHGVSSPSRRIGVHPRGPGSPGPATWDGQPKVPAREARGCGPSGQPSVRRPVGRIPPRSERTRPSPRMEDGMGGEDPVTEADGTSNRDHWARLVKSPGALPADQPKESTYPRFLLCGTCHELFEQEPQAGFPSAQRCRCHPSDEPTWPRFDFNEHLHLCECCRLDPLRSGSRWSVWFCDECKARVRDLNHRLGRYVDPDRSALDDGWDKPARSRARIRGRRAVAGSHRPVRRRHQRLVGCDGSAP